MEPSPSQEDPDESARSWRPTGTVEDASLTLGAAAAPVQSSGKRRWRLRLSRKIIGLGVLVILVLAASVFDRLVNNSGWANSKVDYTHVKPVPASN